MGNTYFIPIPGPTGPAGSPDTPNQVATKLGAADDVAALGEVRTTLDVETSTELDARIASVDAILLNGVGNRSLYNPSSAQTIYAKQRLAEVSSGTSKQLTVLQIGDSLTQHTSTRIIEDYFREWFPGDADLVLSQYWNPIGAVNYGSAPVAATTLSLNGASWVLKTDYSLNFTGSYFSLTSGIADVQVSKTSTTLVATDKIYIPYAIEPGAGTFRVQISTSTSGWGNPADGNWTDPTAPEITSSHTLTGSELIVNADGAFALGVIELEFTTTVGRSYQVLHESGGTVRFLQPSFFSYNCDNGAINAIWLGEGSNDFSSTTDASIPLMAKYISVHQPDFITTQSDDPASSYAAFLPRLEVAIEQANLGYEPLVILIGEAAMSASPNRSDLSNSVQAAYASQYGWYFFDGLTIAKDYDALLDLGWEGDGTHHNGDFYKTMADRIAVELGFDQYPVVTINEYPTAFNFVQGSLLADDWEARVASNSGTISGLQKAAARALAIDIFRLGLRDKIQYLAPIVGDDAAANVVPLIDDLSAGNATLNLLVDGDFSDATGFQTASGTDSYFNTLLDHNDISATPDESWGLFFNNWTSGSPFGVRQNSKDELGWETNMDLHPLGIINTQRFTTSTYPQTTQNGLHIFQNNAGTATWYIDGEFIATRSAASTTAAVPTKTWKLGGMDWFNGSFVETDAAIGLFYHGTTLTGAEAAALSAAIYDSFLTPLGRVPV